MNDTNRIIAAIKEEGEKTRQSAGGSCGMLIIGWMVFMILGKVMTSH